MICFYYHFIYVATELYSNFSKGSFGAGVSVNRKRFLCPWLDNTEVFYTIL